MTDPLLAQYAVLSDRGLHFGRLFWQSIAFHLVMLLAAAAIFRDIDATTRAYGLILAGVVTMLMGFVVWRIWVTERKYEALLVAIEVALREKGVAAIQSSPESGRMGARFAVTVSVGLLGVALAVAGISGLSAQAS